MDYEKRMKILSVAWCIYDERIPEFANNCTGGGLIIKNICEYIGRKESSYLFIGQIQLTSMKLGNINIVNTIHNKEENISIKHRQQWDFNECRLQIMCAKFEEVLQSLKPDIVNFHALGEFMSRCIVLCDRYNIPYVITEHLYIGKNKDFADYEDDVELENKILSKENIKLIAVSTGMRRKILKDYSNIDEKNIIVIPNGTDFKYKKEKTDIYEKYKIDRDKKILLCIGTLTDRKNQEQIVECYHLLEDKLKEKIVILFCGNDRLEGKIQKLINEYNLKKSLIYVGAVLADEIESFYAAGHGLIMASKAEGLSIAALESIRYGLPVIMYRSSECAEDLCDERAVCFAEGRTTVDLKDAIVKWNNTIWDKRYIMKYSEKFSMERMAETYLAYYKEIIERSR